jgi:hypothetical protein
MADATATTDLGAPQCDVESLDDLSVVITTPDLSTQPNNPFQGQATVSGQTGMPLAMLITGTAATISPAGMPTSSGNVWTFTFGSSTAPVPPGDYLFTVRAMNSSGSKSQTIAVKLTP